MDARARVGQSKIKFARDGARFFLIAALLYRYGEPIRIFIERRLTLVTSLFVLALVGGFVALKFVF